MSKCVICKKKGIFFGRVEGVETGQPKKKRILNEAQKENLRLGRAIARKNREEKAKAKLDEMVDNYLKPYAEKEIKEEEKTEPEPVKAEVVKKAPVAQKKKRASKKTRPTSPYSTEEESEKSEDMKCSSEDYTLSSSEESEGWAVPSPPNKKSRTWADALLMRRAMTMHLPISTNVKKNRIAPVNKNVSFI